MKVNTLFYILCILYLCGCNQQQKDSSVSPSRFSYAQNITMEKGDHYTMVKLLDPWKHGNELHRYILVDRKDSGRVAQYPEGTVVYVPLRRAVVFNTAHANLLEMLHRQDAIVGVADSKYMLIPDIQQRLKASLGSRHPVADVGNVMQPDIERIVDIHADAIVLSPFENSGGYGRLEDINIPIIECADYMETSALGRAEWMKFYGMLFGCGQEADSLFTVVEDHYKALRARARKAGHGRYVLPDRKVGSVWYVPGGKSSVGMLYKDAKGRYAFSDDEHSGSLALSFETIIDKFSHADFWILNYNGDMDKKTLLSEFQGYSVLAPYISGEVYGCRVDKTPYFEEVSWRPDWLLQDLVQLFHPDVKIAPLRYYHQL